MFWLQSIGRANDAEVVRGESVACGDVAGGEEEVVEVPKRGNSHDLIMAQDKGYDTGVSEKGASLSGGQRQRATIG